MPSVHYRGREIECEEGAVLRDVLKEAGLSPHNGKADIANCRGHASCGTCAVEVHGETNEAGKRERLRLSTPPLHPSQGFRLACQTRVQGDVEVRKYPGFWGQHVGRAPLPPRDEAGAGGDESSD